MTVFLPVMVLYYLVQVMKEYWPLIGCQRSGDSVPTCNGPLLPCTGNEGVLASDWLSKVR